MGILRNGSDLVEMQSLLWRGGAGTVRRIVAKATTEILTRKVRRQMEDCMSGQGG